jgi:hypothetical protein
LGNETTLALKPTASIFFASFARQPTFTAFDGLGKDATSVIVVLSLCRAKR